MNLAVLFWFYKDVEVCVNRLQILRRFNPTIKIFGFYGGDLGKENLFNSKLSPFLDDFYAFKEIKTHHWKWINGDLMINSWFEKRGVNLNWDSITLIQADMVFIGNIKEKFKGLERNEILLSSIREIKEVQEWWYWVKDRKDLYQEFYQYMVNNLGYKHEPLCCQYVIVCLPRVFLENYSQVENPELGFIEYRVPMYAQLFGIPFNENLKFECWWRDDPSAKKTLVQNRVLTGDKMQIPLWVIIYNLVRKNGARIFHPFDPIFPLNVKGAFNFTKNLLVKKR